MPVSVCRSILALRNGTCFGMEVPSIISAGKLFCITKKEKLIAEIHTSGKKARTSCPARTPAAPGTKLQSAVASCSSCGQSVNRTWQAMVAAAKAQDARTGPSDKWLSRLLFDPTWPLSRPLAGRTPRVSSKKSRGLLSRPVMSPSRQLLLCTVAIGGLVRQTRHDGPEGDLRLGIGDETRVRIRHTVDCMPNMKSSAVMSTGVMMSDCEVITPS